MEKYSIAWKEEQQRKHGGWAQKHDDDRWGFIWKWHYIQYGTEYSTGAYDLKRQCEANHKRY